MDGNPIDSSVYIRIAQIRGSVPIFPTLHVLQFALDEYSGALMNFVSPGLRRVVLQSQNSHLPMPVVGTFLCALVGITPHLKNLYIQCKVSRAAVTVIPQLPTLQSISLLGVGPPDNSTFFRELSTLKHLRELLFEFSIGTVRAVGLPLIATLNTSVGFPALEDLTLYGTWQEVTDALAALRDNRITDLHVKIEPKIKPEVENFRRSCGACLKQIGLHFRCLKNLRISFSLSRSSLDPPLGPFATFGPFDLIPIIIVLNPLLELRQIEKVELLGLPPCNMSDVDVEAIASAWPQAKRIVLPSVIIPGRIQTLPSIAALSSFARLCPELRVLSMIIDARGSAVPPPSILPHHLEILYVGGSWIDNATVVAPYIDRIFPSTKLHYTGEEDHLVWSQVAQWLPIMRSVRADQDVRSRAGA